MSTARCDPKTLPIIIFYFFIFSIMVFQNLLVWNGLVSYWHFALECCSLGPGISRGIAWPSPQQRKGGLLMGDSCVFPWGPRR